MVNEGRLNLDADRHYKDSEPIDTKYSRYSTEQLEVILTHLADPQEKELVKAELSRRYYEHYLGLAKETAIAPPGQAAPEQGAEFGATQEAAAEGQLSSPDDEEETDENTLSELQGVQPVGLPSPAPLTADTPRQPAGPPPQAEQKRCFIATAAYESSSAPEVVVLRQFRDHYLSGRSWGERALRLYYRFSPSVAATLDHRPWLRPLARMALAPAIWWLRKH